jgi:uncharacterized membrane protein
MFLHQGSETGRNRTFSKARLDSLSDGIFGVAMTLLILDVRLPALLMRRWSHRVD